MRRQHRPTWLGGGILARLLALSLVVGLLPLLALTPAQAAGNNSVVQSWAPPGGTNVARTATATAHSNQAAWPASMLVDGNAGTSAVNLWVANETGVNEKGWVNLQLAADAAVSRVVLFPRGESDFYGVYFPARYTVTLLDAQGETVWSKDVEHANSAAMGSRIITSPDVIEVSPAVTARTVRIDVLERHAREGGVLQLAEVGVFTTGPIGEYYPEGSDNLARGATLTAESSLENSSWGWGLQYLKDEFIDSSRGWSSYSLPKVTDPAQPTWVQFDLTSVADVTELVVFPHTRNFPKDYRLQTSLDGTSWSDVANSTGNPDAPAGPQVFALESPAKARFVRLWVDERNTTNSDDAYGYLVQLAELAVFGTPWTFEDYAPQGTTNLAREAVVSYSSSYERANESWAAAFVHDEKFGTAGGWSTNPYDKAMSAATPAWLGYDLGCPADLQQLTVFPREKSFPRDYRLQVSNNRTDWDTVVTSTGNPGTLATVQMFELEPSVSARYVRLYVDTRNEPTGVDGYLAQLSEFAVFGTQSCLIQNKPALLMKPGAVDSAWFATRGEVGPLSFASSDTGVATVADDGEITAVAEGSATVTATAGDAEVSIEVSVSRTVKGIGDELLVAGFWMMDPEFMNQEQFAVAKDFGLDLLMSNENVLNLGTAGNHKAAMLAAENGFLYQPADSRMGWGCGGVPNLSAEQVKDVIADYTHVPGVGSMYVCDEAMPATQFAPAFNTIREAAPELYPHYNFCPWGACGVNDASVRAWLEATGGVRSDWSAPDYLMYDRYPLHVSGVDFAGWFSNLDSFRKLGLEYKVKTGTYLQSVGFNGTGMRAPTSPEIAWQVNTALAYGYKQLAYFTYWQPVNRGETFTEAIIAGDGTKSPRFDDLKQVNSEIHALGPTLMKLDASNVYFNGAANGQAAVPTTLGAPKSDGTLPTGTFFARANGSQNLVLSHLVDRETKEHYLFVVNNAFSGTNPVATNATLTFDASVRGLQEVSRVDGSLSEAGLTDHALPLNLAGAEGRLYKLTVIDTASLEQAIAEASGLERDDYTTSSWAVLAPASQAAAAVLAGVGTGEANQAEVDQAAGALASALASLVLRGDPTVLGALVDAAEALEGKLDGFTDSSVAAFTDALEDANASLAAADDQSQAQLDAAASALRSALDGLTAKPAEVDTSVLQHVVDSAAQLTNTKGTYTPSSWSRLQAEIADARQLLADASPTQAQVDTALKELSSALIGLELARTEPEVVRVKLNQSQLRLVKGKSFTLEEGVYYADGQRPSYSGRVTWTSSDPRVATVNSAGRITARKTGTVTITATSKEFTASGKRLSASIRVAVVKTKPREKVTRVAAAVPSKVRKGATVYLTGTYSSSKATGVKVTYSSTKSNVIGVDKVGRVIARNKGTAKITVKAGGKSRTYTVTVK